MPFWLKASRYVALSVERPPGAGTFLLTAEFLSRRRSDARLPFDLGLAAPRLSQVSSAWWWGWLAQPPPATPTTAPGKLAKVAARAVSGAAFPGATWGWLRKVRASPGRRRPCK